MFQNIFLTELKKNLKSPAFYIFTAILFLGTIIFSSTTDPGTYYMGINHGKEWHNAPIIIAQILTRYSVLSVLFTMILIGRSVAKDFEVSIHEFIFTSPVTKFQYLFGRFTGGYVANILLFASAILGFEMGFLLIDAKYTGSFQIATYLIPMLLTVIPNILFVGAIFFALATLTRKMTSTYLAGVGFIAFYSVIGIMLHRMDNITAKILLDPFGVTSLSVLSEFWTISDMNSNQMPVNGAYIINRIFWFCSSIMILFWTYRKFKFIAFLEKKRSKKSTINNDKPFEHSTIPLPTFTISASNSFSLKQCLSISWKEFKRIIIHPAFIILTFLAISQIITNFIGSLGNNTGSMYPFTSWYINQTIHIWMYMMPMILLFGGMMVWKERDNKTNEIIDTMPIPNWFSYVSKFLILVKIQVFYLILAIAAGVIIQVFYFDYNDIELGLYIKRLFGIDFINFIHIIIIVLFIQNLSPNKYIGFFLSALYFVIDILVFDVFGWSNYLFRYGRIPGYIYSNFNGFGHFGETIIWYTIYWLFIGAILVWLTILLWRKTNENSIKVRLSYLKKYITKDQKTGILILAILFIITGTYIGINKYVINPHFTENEFSQMQADYETKFSKYLNKPQPKITDIYLETDIFPYQRKVKIQGKYDLCNQTNKPIKEIYVNFCDWNLNKAEQLQLSKGYLKTLHAREFGFRIFELKNPLMPGDSISLSFDYEIQPKGFSDNHPINEISENGTFLMLSSFSSDFFPLIGYNVNNELVNDRDRKEFKLKPKPDAPSIAEADRDIAIMQLSRPNYEAVISTAPDQVIVTGGHLMKEWKENDRNYYHYKTDTIIENEIPIVSGRYAVKKEKYKGVNVEVYYHPKHSYNIQTIADGLKASYDYGEKYFKGYPYKDLRIVEIPNYMTYGAARHFPTTFIWVESEGFITRYDDEDDINIVFGIAAHENIHHWWAGIVTPAYAEGAFMLTETICQYAMAMLTEKEYGKDVGRKYIEREMRAYLRSRKHDREGEKPLFKSSVQQSYIGYRKSSVAMYALQDYISEDSVGIALGRIVEEYGFNMDNYPLATDLITELRKVTPDSLQYLITDMFEKITLYENKVDTVTYTALNNGKYKVNMSLESHKFYADSIGTQTEAPIKDYIYVGVLGEGDEEIYYKKHLFDKNKKEFEIIVDKEPLKAGIDPFRILIDRDKSDNMKKTEK